MALAGMVRLDRPFEPADRLSVVPMVSVLDALFPEHLANAMLCAPSFPGVEALSDLNLDELMNLVVEGLSRFSIKDIMYGDYAAAADRALDPYQRRDLGNAVERLVVAEPATAGQRPVFGMPVEPETVPPVVPGSRRHLRVVA